MHFRCVSPELLSTRSFDILRFWHNHFVCLSSRFRKLYNPVFHRFYLTPEQCICLHNTTDIQKKTRLNLASPETLKQRRVAFASHEMEEIRLCRFALAPRRALVGLAVSAQPLGSLAHRGWSRARERDPLRRGGVCSIRGSSGWRGRWVVTA
jgi:hypothetical protein